MLSQSASTNASIGGIIYRGYDVGSIVEIARAFVELKEYFLEISARSSQNLIERYWSPEENVA